MDDICFPAIVRPPSVRLEAGQESRASDEESGQRCTTYAARLTEVTSQIVQVIIWASR